MPCRTPFSRRAALVAAAILAASGCAPDSRGDPSPPTVPAAADQESDQESEQDPDLVLLDEVRLAVGETLALVEATRSRHRTLGRMLRPLATAHRAHAAELTEAAPDSSQRTGVADAVPADEARALSEVRLQEELLARRLRTAAMDAQSGAFARLLGSMGASSAQHLAALPAGRPR